MLKSSAITIAGCGRRIERRRKISLWRGRRSCRKRLLGSETFVRGKGRWFDVGGLDGGSGAALRSKHLPALRFHLLDFFLDSGDDVVEFLQIFEEVADVEEGVAIEANLHKGRLHAGKHARDTPFVDAAD